MNVLWIILACVLPLSATAQVAALFDIGSGKVKMQILSINENARPQPLFCKAVSNGEFVLDQDNCITREHQEKLLANLQTLKHEAEAYSPQRYEAIATELFRKAKNGLQTVQYLSRLTGIDIKVISQTEEGIYGFLTVVNEYQMNPDTTVVVDIGSGSFQITCKEQDHYIVFCSPYGRQLAFQNLKNGTFSKVEESLRSLPSIIKEKVTQGQNIIVGIGSHPKVLLNSRLAYSLEDVKNALALAYTLNIEQSDLRLVTAILLATTATKVSYHWINAGNTTGLLIYGLLNEKSQNTSALK